MRKVVKNFEASNVRYYVSSDEYRFFSSLSPSLSLSPSFEYILYRRLETPSNFTSYSDSRGAPSFENSSFSSTKRRKNYPIKRRPRRRGTLLVGGYVRVAKPARGTNPRYMEGGRARRDGTNERKTRARARARRRRRDREKSEREREGSREIRNTPADRDGQENQSTRNNWY